MLVPRPHPIRAGVALVAALAMSGPATETARAQDSFVTLSGVIAAEQSRTPGILGDGVALLRPDGTFLANEDYGLGGFPALSPDGRVLATSFFGCIYFTEILERTWPSFVGSRCRWGPEPRAADPAWSPDGRHVAFVGEMGEGGDRRWDIFVLEEGETTVRRITTDGVHKADPQWRADGRIAFVRTNPDVFTTDIYSVRWDAPEGTRPVRETTGTNAKFLSYPDLQYGNGSAAYISSGLNNSEPDRLFVAGREVLTRPTWSLRGVAWEPGPTPDHLVVADDFKLLVIDRAGRTVRTLPLNYARHPDWGVEATPDPAPAPTAPSMSYDDADSRHTGADPRERQTRPALREERPATATGISPALAQAVADAAGRVPLELGCPDPVDCRIAVAARASKGAAAAAARSYRVPAGVTRRVRHRLPRAEGRRLKARGRLRVRFALTVTGAHTRRQVRDVTVYRAQRSLRVSRSRSVAVRVAFPASAPAGAQATVTLRLGGRTRGSSRTTVRPGRTATVRLHLPRSAKAGPRRGVLVLEYGDGAAERRGLSLRWR